MGNFIFSIYENLSEFNDDGANFLEFNALAPSLVLMEFVFDAEYPVPFICDESI